ncbi:MAG: electron transport complex subunit RsxA [Rhodospirillaceae bacterium]|nr:electron transport complex subunit RsxA [Rhodospirillaceae bacterium]|tara:strand:+ start:5837 stop:6418 length:582 start_codon:yes stop_codon:yes gene_type:complete
MTELVLIIFSAALVNNFVLVQFLGLCPFLGASKKFEGALGMGLATALVLTIASALSYLIEHLILAPFDVEYLRLISFILVIGASVQFTELLLRRASPILHQVLGIYIPLIASNCAVLGVALLNSNAARNLSEAIYYGAGAAIGFGIALILLSTLRERIEEEDVPGPFRGPAITLITAGIMSIAFFGFTGFPQI